MQILDISSTAISGTMFNLTAVDNKNEPYWVKFIEPHFSEIGIDIDVLPLSRIDKSQKWIINVDVLMYNWNPNVDAFASLGEQIINELAVGNAYLILNHQCESFTKIFFKLLYDVLGAFPSIPHNKIIYMVAAADAHEKYDEFVTERGIGDDKKITIMFAHHVYKRFYSGQAKLFDSPYVTKKGKKFLSLNRMAHSHRVALVSLLAENDLLQHGYVSLGLTPDQLQSTEWNINGMPIPDNKNNKDIVLSGLNKIRDRLPLQIDPVDLSVNLFQLNSLPNHFYQDSYFSLVCSTFGFSDRESSVGFTEKEIKPILAKHPFVIYNLPGVLQHLRNMGFLTFSPWFDESYDTERDDWTRLTKIVNEVKRLAAIPTDNWDSMILDMIPVMEHNYNRLVNYTTEHCFFNSDLKNLIYYVTK